MSKRGAFWPTVLLLSNSALSSAVLAQTPDSALTLELLQRIEQLESEVRFIRGELELYRHQMELLERERTAGHSALQPPAPLSDSSTSPTVDAAVKADQPASASRPPAADQLAVEQLPVARTTSGTTVGAEQADFDAALGEFREGRYSQAIADFQEFLNVHQASPLAGDAQYWLGESYYVSRDHDQAKEAFINMGLRYPKSDRLPDALLKLGYIYVEQGDPEKASTVLQKLMQVYPGTQAAHLAERRLKSLRY